MPLGMDFGNVKRSPYLERKDRAFGRSGGRPVGSTAQPAQASQVGTTGTIGGQATTPGGQVGTGGSFISRRNEGDTRGTGTIGGTGSGIQSTQGQTPYAGFLSELTRPVGSPYQSQFKERANLLRGYTQGAYKTAAEGARNFMGGRGFRAGESGIADTAIGRIQKAGAEELSRGYGRLAADEGRREQEFKLGTAGLNLQRQLGGGGLALRGEEGAQRSLENYYRSQQEAEAREWEPYWQTGY